MSAKPDQAARPDNSELAYDSTTPGCGARIRGDDDSGLDWICTAAAGHTGTHAAWDGTGDLCASWPQDNDAAVPAAPRPEPAAVASAAAVRELAKAKMPEGLNLVQMTGWYAEQLGRLGYHAKTLATEIERQAGAR